MCTSHSFAFICMPLSTRRFDFVIIHRASSIVQIYFIFETVGFVTICRMKYWAMNPWTLNTLKPAAMFSCTWLTQPNAMLYRFALIWVCVTLKMVTNCKQMKNRIKLIKNNIEQLCTCPSLVYEFQFSVRFKSFPMFDLELFAIDQLV